VPAQILNVALLVIDEMGSEPMSCAEVILFLRPMSYLPLRTRLQSHVRNVKGRSYWLRDLEQPVTLRQWLHTDHRCSNFVERINACLTH
jgi:hypothetical protein